MLTDIPSDKVNCKNTTGQDRMSPPKRWTVALLCVLMMVADGDAFMATQPCCSKRRTTGAVCAASSGSAGGPTLKLIVCQGSSCECGVERAQSGCAAADPGVSPCSNWPHHDRSRPMQGRL